MRVKLTPSETELIAWAIDPMYDHWCTEQGAHGRDGITYNSEALPTIYKDSLILSGVDEIDEDLQYRITEQILDMAGDQGGIDQNGVADKARMDALRTIKTVQSIKRKDE